MSLTTSVSLASSVILLGAAVYGIGTWREQERHRARHDIALRAIEATLEALERLDYARNVLTDQREAFRGAMAREEPWEPEDRLRLIQDVREVDVALKHLRTLSHLVRLHLGEKASMAMEELVGLTREFTRTSNLHFNGVGRQLSGDEFKRTYNVLYGYDEKNPFTKELLAARDGLFKALEPFLLS
ncbi:MAG: hypothetical protein NTY63_05670 [Candidatus Bipolaricaulota bacterium]|nr:hypothetical protein [Candidatus Bipolaricaulota bacterium]